MSEQSLVEFLRLGRTDQLSDQTLTAQLQAKGWTSQQINDAYLSLGEKPQEAPWDLIKISEAEIEYDEEHEVVLDSKDELLFESFQKHPEQLKINIILLAIIPVIVLVIIFTTFLREIIQITYTFIFFSFVPIGIYFMYVKGAARRIVMEQVAKQAGWIFAQGEDRSRLETLKMFYPEIFQRGNDGRQIIENQYWGKISVSEQLKSFWQATFKYVVGSGRSSNTYYESVYAFPLIKPIVNTFSLTPNLTLFSGSGSLKTESTDFNRAFTINYIGERAKTGAEIFQVLSPVIQEQLLDLHKQWGSFSLLVSETVIIISLRKRDELKYTNFFKNVSIDPRDVGLLEQRLVEIATAGETLCSTID